MSLRALAKQSLKIKKALKRPERILPYFLLLLRKGRVRCIEKDGEVFYRYKGFLYPEYLKKGNAVSFILDKVRQYCHGKGIDMGAGKWPLPGAILVRNEEQQNAYKLDFSDGSLDYVFSSHCLEHLNKWQDALSLWIRKIKTGGILFLYLPHKSMRLWNPGGPWVGDDHKWIPVYKVINKFLIDNGMEIIEYNSEKDRYHSFHIIAKKIR